MCTRPVGVPATVVADMVEAVVTFPSGPLAGEVRGWKELRVNPRK